MAFHVSPRICTPNLPTSSSYYQFIPSSFSWTPQSFFFPLKLNPSQIPKASLSLQQELSQTPPPSNSTSSATNKIWVNPKNPRASQLSTGGRYASLIKYSNSLNSCNPTEEDVSLILNGLGENPILQDAVIVLNHLQNPDTAFLALQFFLKRVKLKKQVNIYNVVLKVFKKCRIFDKAELLFEEMLQRGVQPDIITFTTLISCANMCNLPNKAVELFEKMGQFGCKPNDYTYSAMIHAYGRAGNVDSALNMYEQIKALGAKPNLVIYNTLLDVVGRAKRPWQVSSIYLDLLDNGLEPNPSTYVTLLQTYCRLRCWEDALFVYREMKEKGVELDVVLYNSLLAACADTGSVEESLEIFDDMKNSGAKPDSWTFSSMIKIYSRNGQVTEAETMLKEMLEAGFEPTIFVLTSLVQCYGKAKQTDDVVKTFNQLQELGLTPDDPFCGCLLNAMTHVQKEELGKLVRCIEKSNPMLGDVVTLLIEEETVDKLFKEKASELFGTISQNVRQSYCNRLIDLCVNLNLLERACALLDLGLTLGIYTAIQSKSPQQWSLQLRKLSPGAALTAFHVWTVHLHKTLEQGVELPLILGISTGQGKHKYSDKRLAVVLESHFRELSAPFHEIGDKVGWFSATNIAVKSWLESSKSPEVVAAETLQSLLLHFI